MKKASKSIDYHADSPGKILFAICFPLVLVNVVLAVTTTWTNQLYSLFVGPEAFAVTGYLSAVTTAFSSIIGSVMSAAWIKTARFFMGDREAATQAMGHGFLAIALATGALGAVLLLLTGPVLSQLHIPEEIRAPAGIYYTLFILCYLPVPMAGLFLTVVNGISNSSRIFWINIVVVALNFLAALLVFAALKLGMVGLALAASVGAVLQIIFDVFYFRRAGFPFSLKALFGKVDWHQVWGIVRYGLLIALQNLLCTSGYLVVTYQTNRFLSMEFISVLNVALPLTGIMSAVGSACMAFCPQNMGPGQEGRLKHFFRLATLFCFGYGIFCFVLYQVLGSWYYGRLFEDPVVIQHGLGYWFWYGLGHISLSLVFPIRSFFDSVGLSKFSLLSGIGELLGNLLCAFWLIPQLGDLGRSLAYPMGWTLAALFLVIAFICQRRKLFREQPISP